MLNNESHKNQYPQKRKKYNIINLVIITMKIVLIIRIITIFLVHAIKNAKAFTNIFKYLYDLDRR
jgi:hypothetical protein